MGNRVGVDLGGYMATVAVVIDPQTPAGEDSRSGPSRSSTFSQPDDESPTHATQDGVPLPLVDSFVSPEYGEFRFFDFLINEAESFRATERGRYFCEEIVKARGVAACTGAGAVKWKREIEAMWDVKVDVHREIPCILAGIDLVLGCVPDACFRFVHRPTGGSPLEQSIPSSPEGGASPGSSPPRRQHVLQVITPKDAEPGAQPSSPPRQSSHLLHPTAERPEQRPSALGVRRASLHTPIVPPSRSERVTPLSSPLPPIPISEARLLNQARRGRGLLHKGHEKRRRRSSAPANAYLSEPDRRSSGDDESLPSPMLPPLAEGAQPTSSPRPAPSPSACVRHSSPPTGARSTKRRPSTTASIYFQEFLQPEQLRNGIGNGGSNRGFYPFLLVNFKAGVSFHFVKAPNESYRIGGSTLGGGTLMGLNRMLNEEVKRPEEAVLKASEGDNSNVDMLVGDIYGGDYDAISLPKDLIASSFGKCQRLSHPHIVPGTQSTDRFMEAEGLSGSEAEDEEQPVGENDISRALLTMVAFNVTQLAYFNSVIYQCDRLVFVGYYFKDFEFLAALQHSLSYWSDNTKEAIFFKQAHWLGAIGAMVKGCRGQRTKEWSKEELETVAAAMANTIEGFPTIPRQHDEDSREESGEPKSSAAPTYQDMIQTGTLRVPGGVLHFHQSAEWGGGSGGRLWEAGIALALFFAHGGVPLDHWKGRNVLELGCGSGTVGLTVAMLGANVTCTDVPEVRPVFEASCEANAQVLACSGAGSIVFQPLDWHDAAALPDSHRSINTIVASDVVFNLKQAEAFTACIGRLMSAAAGDGESIDVWIAHKHRHDDVDAAFVSALEGIGLEGEEMEVSGVLPPTLIHPRLSIWRLAKQRSASAEKRGERK